MFSRLVATAKGHRLNVLLLITLYFLNLVPAAGNQPISVDASQTQSKPSITSMHAVAAAPDLGVKSYILIDAHSGHVLAEKNSQERLAPASLTKVMTLYLTAEALVEGKLNLGEQTVVSEKAWRTGGSRMFIRVGSKVEVADLIKGIAIASGNDATVALAEHIAGSEEVFVEMMNQKARTLHMEDTNYMDSSGLPHGNTYSTAADQAKLAAAWLRDFPHYYTWFNERWINYNGIKQPNRNRLLWRDSSVDGIKTGHTDDAGYCLVTSAQRNQMRLVAVVMGAKTENVRANQSMALLNYGFRFFETHKLFGAHVSIAKPRVFFGKENHGKLGFMEDFYITVPARQYKNFKAQVALAKKHLRAPLEKGRVYGVVNIMGDGKVIATKQLVALADNERCNFLFAIFDYVRLLFSK